MKRGLNILLVCIVSVFLLQMISAGSLRIHVITLEDHSININFLNPDRGSGGEISYGSLNKDTGSGDFTLTFNNNAEIFDLGVFLMKEGKTIVHEDFTSIENDQEILLFLSPVSSYVTESYDSSAVVEESSNSSENVVNNSTNSSEEENIIESNTSSNVSGSVVEESNVVSNEEDAFNFWSFFNRAEVYYALAGFLLLIVLAFVFGAILKHHRTAISEGNYGFSRRKNREDDILDEIDEYEDKIADYDDKVRELRRELKEVRRRNREEDRERRSRRARYRDDEEDIDDDKPRKRRVRRIKSKNVKKSKPKVSKIDKDGYIEVEDKGKEKDKEEGSDRMAEARKKLVEDQIEAARLRSLKDKD